MNNTAEFSFGCSREFPLIRLENVSVTRGGRHLLHRVRCTLHRGAHLAVYGRNGAGKSTFLRVLRGDLPPDAGGVREYCFEGDPVDSPLGLRQRIGLVSPELQARYARQAWKIDGLEVVLSGFFDTQLLYETPTAGQQKAADAILEQLNASRLADCPVEHMSTGELRTILLARALVVRPEVLVLDECMDGLDAQALPAMLSAVERAASMTTIVCAAHRLEQVPAVVRHCLLLRGGEVVFRGKSEDLRAEVATELFRDADAVACDPNTSGPALSFRPHQETPGSLVRLSGVNVVAGGKRILKDIDWEIRNGENWAVAGRNGAGKTSLLRVLCGDLPVHVGGGVAWFGRSGLQNVVEVRRGVGLVSERLQSLYEYDLSVLQLVLSGFFGSIGLYEEAGDDQRNEALRVLRFLGMEEMAPCSMSSLSHGQLRKAFIARSLVAGNRLLLLDEPLSGLDPASRRDMLSLLRRLAGNGFSLVYVTHHQDELPAECSHLLVLDKGRIVFKGPRPA